MNIRFKYRSKQAVMRENNPHTRYATEHVNQGR